MKRLSALGLILGSLCLWSCAPPPTDEGSGATEVADPLAGTQLALREAALEALLEVLMPVPDELAAPAAIERLRALGAQHMPALKGSWAAYKSELEARLAESEYGARAQAYQALKASFDTELLRVQEDRTLWRNLGPELVRFNPIFQP